jgi:hypothetical protein
MILPNAKMVALGSSLVLGWLTVLPPVGAQQPAPGAPGLIRVELKPNPKAQGVAEKPAPGAPIEIRAELKPNPKPQEAGWKVVPQPGAPALPDVRFRTNSGQSLAFSPDGKLLVVGGGDRIRCFAVATGKLLWEAAGPAPALSFAPDGKRPAAPTFWDARTGKVVPVPATPGVIAIKIGDDKGEVNRARSAADMEALQKLELARKQLEAVMKKGEPAPAKAPADLAEAKDRLNKLMEHMRGQVVVNVAPAGGPAAALATLLKSEDPEIRRLAAELLARLQKAEEKAKQDAHRAELEKKIERLMKEVEELKKELRK